MLTQRTAIPVETRSPGHAVELPSVPLAGTVVVWHARETCSNRQSEPASSKREARKDAKPQRPASLGGLTALRESLLLPDELRHADRIRNELARAEFVTARALLRVILGHCLGLEPRRVVLKKTATGKPYVPDWCNPQRLRFNVSHSHGEILIAVARGFEVGVDLEPVRPLANMDEVAAEFMTPDEAFLYDISGEKKPETYFRVWTRKEALLKATGLGLQLPLRLTESLSRRVTIVRPDSLARPSPGEYSLRSFTTETGALAAVSSCRNHFELRHHEARVLDTNHHKTKQTS